MMELGGNSKFKAFCKEQEIDSLPITQKYHTKGAEFYRLRLKATHDGTDLPKPLARGTGKLSADGMSRSNFNLGGGPPASNGNTSTYSNSGFNDGRNGGSSFGNNSSAGGFGNRAFQSQSNGYQRKADETSENTG